MKTVLKTLRESCSSVCSVGKEYAMIKFREISYLLIIAIFVSSVLFVGCSEKDDASNSNERIYVTVNDANLGERELMSMVPSEFYNRLDATYRKEIVQEWVNDELLYQEALTQKLDEEPGIRLMLERSRRRLLASELLERKLLELEAPSDEVLKSYYEENKDMFILQSNEYDIRYALFDTMQDAQRFYHKVKRGASFSDLAKTLSTDPSAKDGGSLGVITEMTVEPTIWNETVTLYNKLGVMKISNPFRVLDGFAIVIIDKVYEAGTARPFETVRDQIYDLYMLDAREKEKSRILKSLTGKAQINFNF